MIKPKLLPDSPGVYFFLNKKGKTIYIGKATSLRSRVRSYFAGNIVEKRGPLIQKMMIEKPIIKFQKTDSVLEALILEAELIKKHSPIYNSKGKDQRSWNYVVITRERFPRVLLIRESVINNSGFIIQDSFGPFPNSNELKIALKILRKIFPFRDRCLPNTKLCFNSQIGLCPGVCIGKISSTEYKKTIRNIKLFFQGKKRVLVKILEKEMRVLAKIKKFEDAGKIKKQIFALNHINDIALIKNKSLQSTNYDSLSFRIEAYDISHTSGTNIVGVMTVLENGELKKSDYRMFKIRGQLGADDTKALSEVLERRLKHEDWKYPDLFVVDGGLAQLNIAERILKEAKMEKSKDLKIVSVVKDERHKPKDILGDQKFASKYKKEILLANSESHRFAIAFHRKGLRMRT